MKITRITPISIASPVTDWTYVRVDTDQQGLYGWGECTLPTKPRGVCGAVQDLEKLVLGLDPLDTEYAWQRMYRHGYWRGGPIQTSAMSGVDIALWDIRGKVAGLPVYKLLGGAVRKRIRLYANIGLSSDAGDLRKRARHALSMGYTAVKMYPLPAVGPHESDAVIRNIVACCEAVREELGAGRDFALDFHGRCTAALAIQIEAAIRHTRPLWIEEPVLPETPNALRRLAEKFVIPIATGERLFTRWGFRDILEEELVATIQPDPANAGGITEMVKIAQLAEMYGVSFCPHNPNGPVQAMTNLHLATNAQAFGMLEHRHDVSDFMDSICTRFMRVEADGCVSLPEGPGLGLDMKMEAMSKLPVKDWIPDSYRSDGSIGDW